MDCDYSSFFCDTRWKTGCCAEMRLDVTIVAVESNKKYVIILCVSAALVIQHALCMRRIVCGLSGSTVFSTLSHKGHDFRKKVIEKNVLIFCSTFF